MRDWVLLQHSDGSQFTAAQVTHDEYAAGLKPIAGYPRPPVERRPQAAWLVFETPSYYPSLEWTSTDEDSVNDTFDREAALNAWPDPEPMLDALCECGDDFGRHEGELCPSGDRRWYPYGGSYVRADGQGGHLV